MTSGLMHEISAQPIRTARSPEELFPLIDYCRAGRLKEVDEWIKAGRPINPPPNVRRSRRRSPLEVAIEKGFFALADLLLDGGATADEAILECAVQHHRVDIAELLIRRGAPPDSIWHGLIYEGGLEMIRLFVAHGFDPTHDLAYHRALCQHVQPHLALLKDYKERFLDLQRQAETALAHYCREGNLRAVSLLCWAGARPDASVSYRLEDDDPESQTTPLEEAVSAGHLPILKRLKPQNYPGVFSRLMDALPSQPSEQMIDYLLELGAPLNTKADGGSRLLEDLIRRLDERYPLPFQGRAERTLALIAHVAERGAKWMPDSEVDIRYYRRRVRAIRDEHLVQLIRILKYTDAATVDFLDAIIASPALKKRLGTHADTIERILHPPMPKPILASRSETTILPPLPRPTAAELLFRAKEIILETVRHKLVAHFTQRAARLSVYAHSVRRRLGLSRAENENLTPIFIKAVERINGKARGFTIEFDDDSWFHSGHYFSLSLKASVEWTDVTREVWRGVPEPNPYLLGDPSLRLFQLIESGVYASGSTGEQEIATKARLGADRQGLNRYLWEIRGKARAALFWKSTGGKRYGEERSYRIWIDAEQEVAEETEGLNPEFEISFDQFTKADLDSTRQRIHKMVVDAAPKGNGPLFILHINSHRELSACFRGDRVTGTSLLTFFEALKFNDALICRYHFGDHADRWFLSLEPQQDWATSLTAVRDELAQPTLEVRFGVSSEAAKLLSWVQSLRSQDMLGCYSPVIENARKRGIGIASPWGDENFPAYVQMLVDEINENTDYDLRLQPWKEYSSTRTRHG